MTDCAPLNNSECQARLAEALNAYHELQTGSRVQSISHNGRSVSYTSASDTELLNYISQLQSICGNGGTGCRRRPAGVYFGDRHER